MFRCTKSNLYLNKEKDRKIILEINRPWKQAIFAYWSLQHWWLPEKIEIKIRLCSCCVLGAIQDRRKIQSWSKLFLSCIRMYCKNFTKICWISSHGRLAIIWRNWLWAWVQILLHRLDSLSRLSKNNQ